MVLRVKFTPTRFPTNSLFTPMDNTPLHSKYVPPVGLLLLLRHWTKSSTSQEERTRINSTFFVLSLETDDTVGI